MHCVHYVQSGGVMDCLPLKPWEWPPLKALACPKSSSVEKFLTNVQTAPKSLKLAVQVAPVSTI